MKQLAGVRLLDVRSGGNKRRRRCFIICHKTPRLVTKSIACGPNSRQAGLRYKLITLSITVLLVTMRLRYGLCRNAIVLRFSFICCVNCVAIPKRRWQWWLLICYIFTTTTTVARVLVLYADNSRYNTGFERAVIVLQTTRRCSALFALRCRRRRRHGLGRAPQCADDGLLFTQV